MSRSNGKARPHPGATLIVEKVRHRAGIDDDVTALEQTIAELNATQHGASWSLPLADGASNKVPVWDSPQQWLHCLRLELDTECGRGLLKRLRTCAKTVLTIAEVMAAAANTGNGRNLTASIATIVKRSGFQKSAVERARAVVLKLGFAVDMATGRHLYKHERIAARAHHGGHQAAAASVWHLTVPRSAVGRATPLKPRRKSASLGRVTRGAHIAAAIAASEGQDNSREDLSSRTSVLEESLVGKNSPKRARAHARCGKFSKKASKERQERPLHAQQAAAELVAASIGLDHGHIGAITDVLIAVGIDTLFFDGYAIKKRMDQHNKDRGLSWPDRIQNPAAFLRALLPGIDWTTQIPSEPAAMVRARRTARRAAEHQAAAERRRARNMPAQITHRIENGAYRAFRALMDHKKPHLAKKSPKPAPVRPTEPLEGGKPQLPWLIEDDAATDPAGGISGADAAGLDRRELEMVAAAEECLCMFCSAPGIVRESVPSRAAVCENCWHSTGFAALYPDTSLVTAMTEAV